MPTSPPLRVQIRPLLRAMRLHQWTKNLLVFVPIVLAGRLLEPAPLIATTVAFLAVGLVASGSYLINDVRDIDNDRAHPAKRHRPLAAGQLSVGLAVLAAGLLVAGSLAAAALVSARVAGFVGVYLALTLAYTLALKRIALLDGLVLATLFTVRIAIGIVAADVPPSPWLLTFSMFIFTSLSYATRSAELAQAAARGEASISGRGYRSVDLPLVMAMGVGAGIGATIIAVLYIIDDAYVQTFLGNPLALWGMPPLVFLFVARIWLKCQRNEMPVHPLDFTMRDPASLMLAGIGCVLFAIAWVGRPWF